MQKPQNKFLRYTGINVYFNFCMFLIVPILPSFIKSLGFNDVELSLLMSLYPVGLILFSPIIGTLSDRIGRKPVIQLGFLAYIIGLNLYLTSNYWLLLATARTLEALAVAAVALVALARVEDALSNKIRGRLTGLNFSFTALASTLGPLASGLLADYFFLKFPIYTSLALLFVFSIFLLFMKDEDDQARLLAFWKKKRPSLKASFNIIESIKEFLSYRELRGVALMGVATHAATTALVIFLPLYITENLGLAYAFIGYAWFVRRLMEYFQFYFGQLTDRFGPRQMILVGCLTYGISLVLIFFVNIYFGLLVLLFVQGIGVAIWNVSAWSLMSNIGEKIGKEGQVVSCYMSLAKIGAFIMSLVAGLVVIKTSIPFLFLISGLLIIVAVAIAIPKLKPVAAQ
jgi:MFS family permease